MGKCADKRNLRLKPEDIYVGMKVKKISDKPFKYGGKTGTVLEILESPYSGHPAVRIAEDNSIVNIVMLKAAVENPEY